MLEKMKAEFEKWHRFPVTDDMDIQTEVAWMNWQAAWNAGVSTATGWRDVVDELPNEAQEVLFVRHGRTVHGAWIGGIFWHNNEKCAAATWRPMPEPPSGNRIGAIFPESPTCTKSQTGDMRRCEACRETGAIHCSDPENCGGPWTVHLTPEINEECDHAWEGGADMSQERCSKCGLSFMRFVHSCCP